MIELLNSMGKSERSGSEFKLIYGDNSTSQYSRLTPTSAVDKIFSPISRFNTGGMVKKKNTAHNDYNGLFSLGTVYTIDFWLYADINAFTASVPGLEIPFTLSTSNFASVVGVVWRSPSLM